MVTFGQHHLDSRQSVSFRTMRHTYRMVAWQVFLLVDRSSQRAQANLGCLALGIESPTKTT